MARETQRRLAAIIVADVVGYSRLLAADETATLSAMRAHRAEVWELKQQLEFLDRQTAFAVWTMLPKIDTPTMINVLSPMSPCRP